MYIDPFIAGVLATVFVEFGGILLLSIYLSHKGKK